MELHTMPNKILVEHHNRLAAMFPDVPQIKSWKQKKEGLLDRISTLQQRKREQEPPKKDGKKDGKKSRRTIRKKALELLCEVAYYEDRTKPSDDENRVKPDHPQARSVGLAYDEIIRRIKDAFPECKTTVACLRWYAVKVRVEETDYEGYRLPGRRPRVKPKNRR